MVERRSRVAMAMAMAVLVAAATIVFTPSSASACSFAPASTTIAGEPHAGGTLELEGRNWFYAPDGVGAMCEGTILPLGPVTIVVSFTTLSGPRSVASMAEVSGESSNQIDQSSYTFRAEVAIPPDATAVEVEATSGGFRATDTALISGAAATTVPQAPTSRPDAPTAATPATAVSGDPSFTG